MQNVRSVSSMCSVALTETRLLGYASNLIFGLVLGGKVNRLSFGSGLLLLVSLVCACSSAPTEILVTVNSDFAIPSAINRVVVKSFDTGGHVVSNQVFLLRANGTDDVAGTYALPLSFAVVPEFDDVSRHAILEIQGFPSGSSTAVVDRKAIMGFVKGEKLSLEIFLAQACVNVTCPGDETCDRGGVCVPILTTGVTHDAGVDAGMSDAATVVDMAVVHDGAVDATVHDASMPDGTTGDGAVSVPTLRQSPTLTLAEPSDGAGAFGFGVAISADGTTIAVGDPDTSQQTGTVYIYHKNGANFGRTPTQTISTVPSGTDWFTLPWLALSGDGTVLVVGAANGSNGEILVFTGSSGTFDTTPAQTVPAPGDVSAFVSGPPSLSADATTLAVPTNGSIVIFTGGPTSFDPTPSDTIAAPTGSTGNYGRGCSLSADGSAIAISDPDYNSEGVVYVYEHSGATFAADPTLTISSPAGVGFKFGFSVALRSDARELIVGQTDSGGATIYVYGRHGAAFGTPETISTPSGPNSMFGASQNVAVSADGTTMLVGDYGTHVYIYGP